MTSPANAQASYFAVHKSGGLQTLSVNEARPETVRSVALCSLVYHPHAVCDTPSVTFWANVNTGRFARMSQLDVRTPTRLHHSFLFQGQARVGNRSLKLLYYNCTFALFIFRLHKLGIEAHAYAHYTSLLCFCFALLCFQYNK